MQDMSGSGRGSQTEAETEPADTGSEVSSLDSVHMAGVAPESTTRELVRSNTDNLVTRTSTLLSYIKEDNRFAKTQVEPSPSYDPTELIRIGTAAPPEREREKVETFGDVENTKSDIDDDDDDVETQRSAVVQDTGEYNIFDVQNEPPDKGFWAWTAAFCVLFINTFSWGPNAAFGVYLNYYTTTDFFPGASVEQYVMIGGLGLGASFMACTITNALCRRFYFKYVMSAGTALIFLSYWLASISKTVIQLIMFQGFMMSFGFAAAAGSCFVILPTWFLKRRSIAQGIAAAGGGLGGIIFSRPIDAIIKRYIDDPRYADNPHEALRLGIAWALRMEALVCGFSLVVCICLLRTYRPLINEESKKKPFLPELYSYLLRFDLLKQPPLICIISWNMVYGLTYTILLFSLSSYASSIGLSYRQGSNVTNVQSVAQAIGRPLTGMCSDKIGRVNTTIIFTLIITILIFFFWIFITTYSQLLAFAFLAGFILGVNWVNFGPMTADIVGAGPDLTDAISILMFTGGIPQLIAELVGLKLRRPELSKPFLYCQILCGVAGLVSALLLFPLREWKVKRILLARRNHLLSLVADSTEKDDATITKTNDRVIPDAANGNFNDDLHENQVHVQEEIKRLDTMLQSNIYFYIFRTFYPIAV